MKKFGILRDMQQARLLMQALDLEVHGWLGANGTALQINIGPLKRTSDQNAKFHALCSDIAKSKLPWAGKPRSATQWKVLLVSGHATLTKEGSDMVPGLEGEFINIRESTALMSIARGSSLIEYTLAFCAEHGVPITYREPEYA